MVIYEWIVEEQEYLDDLQEVDIIETYHFPSFKEAMAYYKSLTDDANILVQVALTRDQDGFKAWAYLQDNTLPSEMKDSGGSYDADTPKRFIGEVEKYFKK